MLNNFVEPTNNFFTPRTLVMNKRIFILLISILFMSLWACNEAEDSKENGLGTATFILENGQKVDFQATFNTSISLHEEKMGLGLSNSLDGTLVYITMLSHEPLSTGNYDGYITVSQIGDNDIIDEKYNSHFHVDKDSLLEGTSTLIITDVDDQHIKGNFSGTLYSETGKQLMVENGKFDVRIQTSF